MQRFEYERFELPRLEAVPEEQRQAILAETQRLDRALEHDDKPQAIGALKDLIESIARSVKELNGEAVGGGEDAAKVIKAAHELLRAQPGPSLSHDSRHSNIAASALKIVAQIPAARNAAGTGHGRATVPDITEDELTLMLDGALMWSRWALRRLDAFCLGRPIQLVDALKESTWTSGTLARRLAATNLTDEITAAQVGNAVGRRAAGGTFTVYRDGITTPANSEDLQTWPVAYRRAAARALMFDTAGNATVDARHLTDAIQLVRPTLTGPTWSELVDELLASFPKPLKLIDGTETNWRSQQLRNSLQELARRDEFGDSTQRLIERLGLGGQP